MVENSPFDHPFHNGIFVGQNPVRVGEREGNFWALPVKRSHDDHIMKKMGRMDPQGEPAAEVTDAGVRFTLKSIWRDEQEQPLIDEERTVVLRALPDATRLRHDQPQDRRLRRRGVPKDQVRQHLHAGRAAAPAPLWAAR